MSSLRYELAQANVAYMLAPHDDPRLADYMVRLDEINGLADRSPGFVPPDLAAREPGSMA